MNLNIQKLIAKKITRREFLVFLGMLGITIFGIPSILKSISNLNPNKKQSNKIEAKSSFGLGTYGV